MFERCSDESRAVLVEAQDLALELRSGYVSVGHIFYGCTQAGGESAGKPLRQCGITGAFVRSILPRTGEHAPLESVDLEALHAIGVDYEGVQAAVNQTFGPGALDAAPDRRVRTRGRRRPPFTAEAKRSLQLSLRVAVELHHGRLMPGHLLLGLLRLDDELIVGALITSGTTVAALSGAVLSELAVAA